MSCDCSDRRSRRTKSTLLYVRQCLNRIYHGSAVYELWLMTALSDSVLEQNMTDAHSEPAAHLRNTGSPEALFNSKMSSFHEAVELGLGKLRPIIACDKQILKPG
uniref:Uncharacterized protein n=1 Tax=Spongospora subterranea TaxID=70186 RepID=A0A0H5QFV4_9EUKA|eukprot:CRZ00815.1 hypothetical protein [Spongospora subterranea]